MRVQMRARAFTLLLVLAASTAGAAAVDKPPAHEHVVTIKVFQYQPAEVTVNAGETVKWENQDIVPHTVTADDGSFQSGTIDPGKSWSYTPKTAGRFTYTCTPHPNMHGVLVVQ
jgi:plastocyanin